MNTIYAISHSILSPLGNSSQQNFDAILQQQPAIKQQQDSLVSDRHFYAARLASSQTEMLQSRYSKSSQALSPFEQMCVCAIEEALNDLQIDVTSDDCILILSSTKGNIEWLGKQPDEQVGLQYSAQIISAYFGMKHKPLIISNACISGSMALIMGKRLLQSNRYKHAIVIGCDRFSGFVFSGFQSFHALADRLCKPFDKDRNGINLGEAAACIVLSSDKELAAEKPLAILSGGGLSNDANHLSGPSRTGAELANAIAQAMDEAIVKAEDIGLISAHGTATIFNDEMEAKALQLAKVNTKPMHSLKSYVGHTLGAAGLIESVIACMAMQASYLPASLGFVESGVPVDVNITTTATAADYNHLLKTASGFGGCNAALVWTKYK